MNHRDTAEGHEGVDLFEFTRTVEETHQIPEVDLLVGFFQCQDYSVEDQVRGAGDRGREGSFLPIWRIISRSHANQTRHRQSGPVGERAPSPETQEPLRRGLNHDSQRDADLMLRG